MKKGDFSTDGTPKSYHYSSGNFHLLLLSFSRLGSVSPAFSLLLRCKHAARHAV